jgi:hypothetical protein
MFIRITKHIKHKKKYHIEVLGPPNDQCPAKIVAIEVLNSSKSYMGASIRRFPAFFNTTGVITADELGAEAGLPFFSARRHHSYDNVYVTDQFLTLKTLLQRRAQIRGLHPLPQPEHQTKDAGTHCFPIKDRQIAAVAARMEP